MKNKSKHRSNKNNKRLKIRQCSTYEPDFKKAVVLYAEQRSTSEAKRRYGISESNIRRWRRLKNDILEKASQAQATRKSARSNNTFESSIEDFDAFEFSSSLDSMPLEQRLSKTSTDQEPVLQSQPLSPTKLKVTRQSAKPPQPSPKPPTPEPPNEEVCLRWNSHHSNMQSTFPNLLLREQYVDATLVAEGQTLKCHRLILSSCSPYFEEVLSGISPFQHPVLFMKDVPFWILKSLCDFMYAGEVHIFQNKLEELLAVAETLKIKGLAGKPEGSEETKPSEPNKVVKEEKEKKEDKDVRDRKKQQNNLQQNEQQLPKSSSKPYKSVYASKRNERLQKEIVKSDDILDPLDLLEPVYEELTKESKPPSVPVKFKEAKVVPMKKGVPKKIKKRKLSEEREESPPPLFLSRKGTRSRPNVKVPKYYHPTYDRALKSMELLESTIVREPHTDQADPLMQVEEIKAEPLDLEDDVIEIEDNMVEFSDHEMPLQEEEIIGDYDSPIVNITDDKDDGNKGDNTVVFKKISLVPQPIIMDVHSIEEKGEDTLKIVDVSQIKDTSETIPEKNCDPLATEAVILDVDSLESNKAIDDPLNLNTEPVEKTADDIKIASVESLVENDMNATGEKGDNNLDNHVSGESVADATFEIEKVVSVDVDEDEDEVVITNEENLDEQGAHTGKIANEQFVANEENESGVKNVISEDCASALGFQITNVVSGHFEEADGKVNEDDPHNDTVEDLDLEVVVNDSSDAPACESQGKKDSGVESSSESAVVSDGISEETRLIADSLEELLEK